jgi:hypothetical protein
MPQGQQLSVQQGCAATSTGRQRQSLCTLQGPQSEQLCMQRGRTATSLGAEPMYGMQGPQRTRLLSVCAAMLVVTQVQVVRSHGARYHRHVQRPPPPARQRRCARMQHTTLARDEPGPYVQGALKGCQQLTDVSFASTRGGLACQLTMQRQVATGTGLPKASASSTRQAHHKATSLAEASAHRGQANGLR